LLREKEAFVKRQTLINIGGYLLALCVLAYVINSAWKPGEKDGLGAVWQRHVVQGQPAHLGFLALAVVLYIYAISLTIIRWWLLVRAQDLPFRLVDAFRLGLFGQFCSTFLLGSVGGDVPKAAFLARGQSRRTVAVATVIMDRVIALWGLIWFVAILGSVFWLTGLLEPRGDTDKAIEASAAAKNVVQIAGGTVVVSLSIWLLLGVLSSVRAESLAVRLEGIWKIGMSAAEFWRAVWIYRCRQKSVWQCMLISWAGHVGFVLAFYSSARVLWDPDSGATMPSLVDHFLLVPIGLVVQAMPLFPGGAGIGEAGFGGLYEWFGGDKSAGILGSLVQRLLMCLLGIVGLGVSMRLAVWRPAPPSEPAKTVVPGDDPRLAPRAEEIVLTAQRKQHTDDTSFTE